MWYDHLKGVHHSLSSPSLSNEPVGFTHLSAVVTLENTLKMYLLLDNAVTAGDVMLHVGDCFIK